MLVNFYACQIYLTLLVRYVLKLAVEYEKMGNLCTYIYRNIYFMKVFGLTIWPNFVLDVERRRWKYFPSNPKKCLLKPRQPTAVFSGALGDLHGSIAIKQTADLTQVKLVIFVFDQRQIFLWKHSIFDLLIDVQKTRHPSRGNFHL